MKVQAKCIWAFTNLQVEGVKGSQSLVQWSQPNVHYTYVSTSNQKQYYVIAPWRQNHKILAPPQQTCTQNFQAHNFVIKDAFTYSWRWLNGEDKGLRKFLQRKANNNISALTWCNT
jgi:hypothetical protein